MAGLKAYRAKRNFEATPEPRGRVVGRARSGLGFVVQRHAATRLHYDFRLELDGVLKSWAVTKVPSPDPATKRLAVEVEDHPLEYGRFEGIIPEGEYGGGTVQLWDDGRWEPEGDPRNGLARGHLKFALHGKRLKGGWVLVRMADRATRPGAKARHNWLLIKERDEDARPGEPDALSAEETSVRSGRTLEEIAGTAKPRLWRADGKARAKRAALVAKVAAKKSGKPGPARVKKKTATRRARG